MAPAQKDEVITQFAVRLRAARKAHKSNFSQSDLAERTGLQQQTISALERGESEPQLSTLVTICRELNVSPNKIIGWGSAPVLDHDVAKLIALIPKLPKVWIPVVQEIVQIALATQDHAPLPRDEWEDSWDDYRPAKLRSGL